MNQANNLNAKLTERLTDVWTPACWFGFFTEALPELDGYPAHFLVACWQPVVSPLLPQLPHLVAIISRSSANAAAELLRLVPLDVPIILLKSDQVNVGLITEMILSSDRHLTEHYRQGLEAFVEADRGKWRRKIQANYSDVDDSFERFKSKLLDNADPQT